MPGSSVSRTAESPRRRAANPLKVVVTAGGAGAVALILLFTWLSALGGRAAPLQPAEPAPEPRRPVLSARRTPDVLSLVTRTSRVTASLAEVRASVPKNSCLGVTWLGRALVSDRLTTPLVPGSAVKIATAAVALDVLGRDTRFTTSIRVSRAADGSVTDLFVVGGGDPVIVRNEYVAAEKYATFNRTSLESVADRIVAAGITGITGRIVGVDTLFDSERWVAQWPASFRGLEAGPLGALMVNDGAVLGLDRKPDDPAVSAASELRTLLQARGVTVGGPAARDVLPGGTQTVVDIQSAPLTGIVNEMLVNSDNNTAEILLKHIGLKAKGVGSTANGIAAVIEKLTEWKLSDGVVLTDGSGLSSANLVPCRTYLGLLRRFEADLPSLMAVAGRTGTLRDSFTDSPVAGTLVGKTGTLSGVKSLVGYLPVEGDGAVRFALVMNRQGIDNRSAYRTVWSGLAKGLAGASDTPRAGDLAP